MNSARPESLTAVPIIRAATVCRPPEESFRVFTEEIGAWWPLPTHGLFGDQSGGLMFRDGQLIELALDGAETVWGEIRVWDPPHRLVVSWHPGRADDEASEVEVLFERDGAGTRVVLEHRGWEAFGADAMQRRRGYIGPNAWGYVLDHFADGAEAQLDEGLIRLVAAYKGFFDVAELGGFGAPPAGEWSADQVMAHVALNDLAMVRVCQALVHGESARFENQVCQNVDVLARWMDASDGQAELIARARQTSKQVVAGISRLSSDQRDEFVHCHMTHDGQVVLDDVRPWGAIAIDVQAEVHLPAHTQQLRDLRS